MAKSNDPVRVRLLTPDDASAYAEVRHAMLVDSPLAFASSPGSARGSDARDVARLLGEPGQAIVGALDRGSLVSVAGLVRETKPKLRHRAFIWGVWTEPAHRGRGLARSVMLETLRTARSWEGVRVVYLSAGEGQTPARALYEGLGFVAWGTEPNALLVDGQLHAEVHYQLVLE